MLMPGMRSRSPRLGIHDGNSSHVHDVLHVGAALQHVHRTIHAYEYRAYGRSTTQMIQQLVRDVASAEVREDQHVRGIAEKTERIRRVEQRLVERRVGLHLSIDDERRIALP